MNLEHALQEHAEALERDASKEIAALLAERGRLREALKKIDSLATKHEAGAIGKAQKIARQALTPKETP